MTVVHGSSQASHNRRGQRDVRGFRYINVPLARRDWDVFGSKVLESSIHHQLLIKIHVSVLLPIILAADFEVGFIFAAAGAKSRRSPSMVHYHVRVRHRMIRSQRAYDDALVIARVKRQRWWAKIFGTNSEVRNQRVLRHLSCNHDSHIAARSRSAYKDGQSRKRLWKSSYGCEL